VNAVVRRRLRNLALTGALGLLLATAFEVRAVALYSSSFLSGWVLLGSVLFLALYNVRKKFAALPVGGRSTWPQLHFYLGLLTVLGFLLHIEWRWPDGWLDGTLGFLFAVVAGSGVLGLWLMRTVPHRLTRTGEEVLFERIPGFIALLRAEAESIALEAARETGSSSTADYYARHLADFFSGPRNLLAHLYDSEHPLFRIELQFAELDRYLDQNERVLAEQMLELVRRKDDLDRHYALQGALKLWLFVHVPFTYALIAFALVHAVLVHAFGGGL